MFKNRHCDSLRNDILGKFFEGLEMPKLRLDFFVCLFRLVVLNLSIPPFLLQSLPFFLSVFLFFQISE